MSTTVTEQIKILVELQKIDAEIFLLKKELSSHPQIQKQYEAEFEKKKAAVKAAEDSLKAEQLKQKQKEGDLAAREEKISKLQAQLYQLKSNKEYSAMELEIKGLKADKSLLEEEILGLLDTSDQAKAALAKEKEALGAEEKKHQARLAELKAKSEEIQKAVSAGDEKRKAYTPNIEPRLLSQYERLLKNREGLALVPVVHNACGGCHMGLPPQVVNETQQHEKWIVCESCARLLYWPSW
jgi:predicted  nucleic acid-binding Zn-ribbon protein